MQFEILVTSHEKCYFKSVFPITEAFTSSLELFGGRGGHGCGTSLESTQRLVILIGAYGSRQPDPAIGVAFSHAFLYSDDDGDNISTVFSSR